MKYTHLWLAITFFLAVFAGTLVVLAPALAAQPVAFAVFFSPVLGLVMFTHWLMPARWRFLGAVMTLLWLTVPAALMLLMGAPMAALWAFGLALLCRLVVKSKPSTGRPATMSAHAH